MIHIDVSCAPSGRCTFGEWTRGVAGRCPACPGLQSRRPSGGPRRRCTMPTRGAAPGPAPGERSCRPSGGPRRRWRLKAEPCAHTPFVARLGGSWGRLKGGRKIARGKPGNARRRPGSTPQNAQRPEGAQETRLQPVSPSAAQGRNQSDSRFAPFRGGSTGRRARRRTVSPSQDNPTRPCTPAITSISG